ncbi:MAG TPA: hypothetical protein VJ697_02195 [Nitrososphaeraceae archaeon]|nr:hypothetical protein [Nitrososphaeraceae archaeon]
MLTQYYIYPIDSEPYGITYGEWSIRWWQWLLSIPKENNPALDWIGTNAHINQIYPNVFFLCQTIEGVEAIPIRKITIPFGKAIFMPIINWISIQGEDGNTAKELKEVAQQRMNVIGSLEFTINELTINKGLEKYRVLSSFFEIDLPQNNVFGLTSGKRLCISDGYWIFIKFFSKNIKFCSFSSCSSGLTQIKVNYEVINN